MPSDSVKISRKQEFVVLIDPYTNVERFKINHDQIMEVVNDLLDAAGHMKQELDEELVDAR